MILPGFEVFLRDPIHPFSDSDRAVRDKLNKQKKNKNRMNSNGFLWNIAISLFV